MSYLVLARKWRPQTFADVVGQEHIRKTLANAIETGRIGHAFLFAGPRGVGKTTVARLLAKAVNCKSRTGAEPCNQCEPCREITAGNAIDVLEIDGASNRGIDEIRELCENAKYAPSSLTFKVYIIDEVHMLTLPAFNALLKTLEEPPEHVKFILATTELHKVPVTIRSRCQRFQFKRMAVEEISSQLKTIIQAEGIKTTDRAIQLLARMADGSMRDGESILDQMLAFSHGEITYEMALDLLGRLDPETIHELGSAILQGNISRALDLIYRFLNEGGDLVQILPELMEYFRDLLIITSVEKPETLIDRHEQQVTAMQEMVRNFSIDKLAVYFRVIAESERQVRYSPLPRAELETVIMQLCRLHRLISLDRLIQKTDRIEITLPAGSDGMREISNPLGSPKLGAVSHEPQADSPPPTSVAPQEPGQSLRRPMDFTDESHDSTVALKRENVQSLMAPWKQGPDTTGAISPQRTELSGSDQPAQIPTTDRLAEIWRQVVEELIHDRPLRTILEYSGLENRNDGLVTLVFGPDSPEFYKDRVEERESHAMVTKALEKKLGRSVNLRVLISTEAPQTLLSQIMEEKKAQNKEKVRKVVQNPLIREAVEIFQGTVIKVVERTDDFPANCQENGDVH